MKKYLAAAVVAVMVFAFAAFAASLNVTSTALQAGDTEPGALECANEAVAYVWGYNDHETPPTAQNVGIALQPDTHTCEGETITVNLLNEDGNILVHEGQQVRVQKVAVSGADQGRFELPGATTADKPAVEDIYGVRVGIDQGQGVGDWDDSPLNPGN